MVNRSSVTITYDKTPVTIEWRSYPDEYQFSPLRLSIQSLFVELT